MNGYVIGVVKGPCYALRTVSLERASNIVTKYITKHVFLPALPYNHINVQLCILFHEKQHSSLSGKSLRWIFASDNLYILSQRIIPVNSCTSYHQFTCINSYQNPLLHLSINSEELIFTISFNASICAKFEALFREKYKILKAILWGSLLIC